MSALGLLSVVVIVMLTILCTQYPEAIDDFLINQQIIDIPSRPFSAAQQHHIGALEMASSSVTFTGICRNSGDKLPELLARVNQLAAAFHYSQALFVVGDSDDNTFEVLSAWAWQSTANRSIVASHDEDGLVETYGPFQGTKFPREGRIATARNRVLAALRMTLPSTDYVINLDMDIIGWNNIGIQDSFDKHVHWDVVCANGILLHGVYRDTYAFRMLGVDTNHHRCGDDHYLYNISAAQRLENRKHLRDSRRVAHELLDSGKINLRREQQPGVSSLIEVDSCFGGLAIYK